MQWFLIIVIAAAAAGLAVQQFQARRARAGDTSKEVKNPYHCVAVEHGWFACDAAQRLGEKRFLSREAPRLPLPGCSLSNCQCRYRHHEDRRAEERRTPYGRGVGTAERRRSDRRATPHRYA